MFPVFAKIWLRLMGGVAVIMMIYGLLCYLDKKTAETKTIAKENKEKNAILRNITLDLLKKPVRFSPEEIAASTSNYATKLGSGGFGDVYKGELPNGVKFAVKVIKSNIGLEKRVLEEQFMAEVATIRRTYKCDVYSFGIMLFEIIGRKRNLKMNSSTDSSSQQWFSRKVWEEYEKGELEKLFIENGIEIKDK